MSSVVFATTASKTLFIADLNKKYDLSSTIEILPDPQATIAWSDLEAGKFSEEFSTQLAHKEKPLAAMRYWFRMTLQLDEAANFSTAEVILYTPVKTTMAWELNFRVLQDNKLIKAIDMGHQRPFYQREINSIPYAIKVPVQKNIPTYVIGLFDNRASNIPLLIPFYIIDAEKLQQADRDISDFHIAFYSMMLALFIYNFVLFISLRERAYGYYLLFILSAGVLCSIEGGISHKYFFPESPVLNNKINQENGILTGMFYSLFVYNALSGLNGAKIYLRIHRLLVALGLVGLAVNLIIWDQYGNIIPQTYPMIVVLLNLIVIIYAIKQGDVIARFILVAVMFTMTGGTVYLNMIHSVLPINWFTYWSLHWGFLGESLMLSLALAMRTRHAQDQAVNNLLKFEKLYDESTAGLFEYSLLTNGIKGNKTFANLFGYTSAEDIPANFQPLDFLTGEDKVRVPELLFAAGRVANYELKIDDFYNAKKFWISLSMNLILDSKNQPLGIEGSMLDISEKKYIEQAEKQRAEAEREQRIAAAESRAKSDFLSKMSHEIRTPMTAIIGMSELLKERANSRTDIQYIDIIQSSGETLLTIINDILDYSKIEAGKMTLEAIPIELEKIAYDALGIFKSVADKKGLQLILSAPANLPQQFVGDPTRIKQILMNLLGNAIKFTEVGSIMVEIAYFPHEQRNIRLAIVDTGIGVATENQAHLFQDYSQAQADTARRFGGTGLGLSICKQLAELMAGEVGIISTKGEGATFYAAIALKESNPEITIIPRLKQDKLPKALIFTPNINDSKVLQQYLNALGLMVEVVKTLAEIGTVTETDLLFVGHDYLIGEAFGDRVETIISNVKRVVCITPDYDFSTKNNLPNSNYPNINFPNYKFLLTPIYSKNLLRVLSELEIPIPSESYNTENQTTENFKKNQLRDVVITPRVILVAEDNTVNQMVIEKMLQRLGHQCEIVNNGREAMERYAAQCVNGKPYDIVLMDCEMPIMDGYEATQAIRRYEEEKNCRRCPVIALTAHIMEEEIKKCQQAGMDNHITKPINQVRLAQLLNSP